MKRKAYEKPVMTVVAEVSFGEVMAASNDSATLPEGEGTYTGPAGAPKRNGFWQTGQEE